MARDFSVGASDLSALGKIIAEGWELRMLSNLHAKIYLFDHSKMIVGSGNWTNKGLRLCGEGNLEAALEVAPDDDAIAFIDGIMKCSTIISETVLLNMIAHLDSAETDYNSNNIIWPDGFFDQAEFLLVSDFPFSGPGLPSSLYKENSDLPFAQLERAATHEQKEDCFKKTKALRWLIDTLKRNPQSQMYFGELSSVLHEALADDPAPYRRQIKELLAALLEYVKIYSPSVISVSRPNHSQLIKLI